MIKIHIFIKTKLLFFTGAIILLTVNVCFLGCGISKKRAEIPKTALQNSNKFDDTGKQVWPDDFKIVEVTSSKDKSLQKSYFRKSKLDKPMPLFVSLHTWSGDYTQKEGLLSKIQQYDWNYIHPDFRGPNWTNESCCSEIALADIDDAIDYALVNCNVDSSRIYIIGASGGGYAALSMFMKSKHQINSFYAWVPVSDLVAFYFECLERKSKYANDILLCTGSSSDNLNEKMAKEKSPVYWPTPVEKFKNSKLNIYAGVNDGLTGAVPITHSINFYNKILKDMGVIEKEYFVSDTETSYLLENRKPISGFGKIGDREICIRKKYKNLSVIIFNGGHEMLLDCAFELITE